MVVGPGVAESPAQQPSLSRALLTFLLAQTTALPCSHPPWAGHSPHQHLLPSISSGLWDAAARDIAEPHGPAVERGELFARFQTEQERQQFLQYRRQKERELGQLHWATPCGLWDGQLSPCRFASTEVFVKGCTKIPSPAGIQVCSKPLLTTHLTSRGKT